MYQRHPSERTGSCAALITGHDRSLVTNLGAALKFSHKFLQKPENWEIVEKADVIYIGGFVFDVSVEYVRKNFSALFSLFSFFFMFFFFILSPLHEICFGMVHMVHNGRSQNM